MPGRPPISDLRPLTCLARSRSCPRIWEPAQGAPKNVPNGPANTGKTVETVKKLRDLDATPLKRAEAGC